MLRPYQEALLCDAFAVLRRHLAEDERPWSAGEPHPVSAVCQMATGAGKTHAAAELVRRFLAGELDTAYPRPLRVQFWADLREITSDTVARFRGAGLDVGIVAAGHPATEARVQVVQVQTATRRADGQTHLAIARPDLLILDEAHICQGEDLDRTLRLVDPAILVGLTATPSRGDGKGLGRTFRALVQGPQTGWLQAHGWCLGCGEVRAGQHLCTELNRWIEIAPYLVPLDTVAPSSGYLARGLAMEPVEAYHRFCRAPAGRGRIACADEPAALCGTPRRCVEGGYCHSARPSRALIFCADGAARSTAAAFQAAGIPAEVLAADTRPAVRKTQRARLASGELLVLCTVDCAIKGWDSLATDTVILARAVGVPGVFLQMVGRALRPDPSTQKTRARLIDLRGNVYLHGLPEEDRVWSLGDDAVTLKAGAVAYSRCLACGWLGLVRKGACPRCAAPLGRPVKPPRVLRAEKMERVAAMPWERRRAEYERNATWALRGRASRIPGWAQRKIKAEMEKWDARHPKETT